jgi:hypothetical protein
MKATAKNIKLNAVTLFGNECCYFVSQLIEKQNKLKTY